MSDYQRPIAVPADGRPRKLDAGWFVAYLVRAPSENANMAAIQARIKAKIGRLVVLDVCQAVEQAPDDEDTKRPLWLVELQVEAPKSGVLGI